MLALEESVIAHTVGKPRQTVQITSALRHLDCGYVTVMLVQRNRSTTYSWVKKPTQSKSVWVYVQSLVLWLIVEDKII